ncbi:MAG: zonular occludens toxin domain-containing protein [Pseudomonadota bacterium]|nr:zonular occludens toxin domain-containing protein [Pseudomonadota bacterium]
MITLITGLPSSGKTLYAASLILDYTLANADLVSDGLSPRQIYADIDRINIESVLPAPLDWRQTPDGSILFYDNIHSKETFSRSSVVSDVLRQLEIHRHTRHDIFLISQSPAFLHRYILPLVTQHFHLSFKFDDISANVTLWDHAVIDTSKTHNCISHQVFNFQPFYKFFNSNLKRNG